MLFRFSKHRLEDEAFGYLERVIVTLAVHPRMFEFYTLTFSTRAKCRNGVVCVSAVCVLQSVSSCTWMGVCGVCVCACACVPSVPVFGSLLQAPSLVSHWNIALGISVLSLFPKLSHPEAFTRVNWYRRRGIEHQKHSTIKQTRSKQGCDYIKTPPCRHYAFHKRADTAEFQS